jgi:putative lipoic acid-binding regulatory protein
MVEGSPLAFPCDFPIKVMGRKQPGFAQEVMDVVLRHAPDFDPATMQMRPSRQNRYLGITCVVRATSREQLDNLYRELTSHPMVKMVL